MKKATLLIAVLEAAVLLVMKFCSWHEGKEQKPNASKANSVAGHRVVNPSPQEYDGFPPEGESDAINILASGDAADEKIQPKK